jgi:hypothetical protein
MNRVLAAVVVLVSASLLASACGSARQASSLPGLTAGKLAELKAMVKRAATVNGDTHPSSATVYASRRHEANIAAGAGSGIPGEQPVYLVVIRGHFVCSRCSSPGGSAVPHGNVLTMVVGRSTLQDLDGGVGGQVHTSKLGPGLPIAVG